jgi:hypothetical protein
MLEQLIELSRKAVESSLQMQQALFKQCTQDWTSPTAAVGLSADLGGSMRKRFTELTIEALNKHRVSLDAAYKASIETLEHALRATEAKSKEESLKGAEDVWHKMFDTFKTQTESQVGEFQKWAEKSFELARAKPAM